MTIEQFILIYKTKSEKDVDNYIKDHIVNKYIPYNQKIVVCTSIIDNTMYEEVNNVKIYKQNTPSRYLFFTLQLIKLYTDLEINFSDNPLEIYDKLNECGLIDRIISLLPQSEYIEFNTIMDMIIDDRVANERDLVSFIESKIDLLKIAFNIFNDALVDEMEGNNDGISGDDSL